MLEISTTLMHLGLDDSAVLVRIISTLALWGFGFSDPYLVEARNITTLASSSLMAFEVGLVKVDVP
ncbi:unnamed protein product [Clonostachys solani]|uniref:Uncharacterized protein n=1 Tax=Clonostachys solani TaxID=160281 RepID=A0A9N9ZC48_9HYPO|nr:unnamed protein product [Clonostachys solani]